MEYASASGPGFRAGPAALRDSRARSRAASRILLALGDIIAVEIALAISAGAGAFLFGPAWVSGIDPVLAGLAAAVGVFVPHWCFGLYGAAAPGPIERFRLHAWGTLLIPWLAAAIMGLADQVTLPAFCVLTFAALLFIPIALVVETRLRQMLIARSLWGTTALLIGAGDTAARVSRFLLAHPELGLRPVGYVGDPAIGDSSSLPPRLGAISDAGRFTGAAEVAVVAMSPSTQSIELTRLPFRRVIFLPDLSNSPALWGRSRAIGNVPALEFFDRAQTTYARCAKRLLDLAISVPLLLFCLPLLGVLALAIKIVSPGPALYVQHRVGVDGRPIAIFKLRSMRRDAEQRLQELLARDPVARMEWQKHVKLRNDPRILPFIGQFIRRTSLDELPQLWNVIRGDISLVGPRPFPDYHLNRFDPAFRALRQSIRPGLTGLWQVSDRSDADLPQQEALDSFYIRNWSIWLDLWIVLHTLPAMLSPRGAR